MFDLVFATNNLNKLEEIQAIVGADFSLKSLKDIGCFDDIPETGNTFHENAKQKTDYLVQKYQVDCFADDSGLEIDVLSGEPGVLSARYSGSRCMEDNIDLVLKKLVHIPTNKKNARFKTVLSLFLFGQQYYFEGVIEGHIIEERRGANGFGYDPIFVPAGFDKTFAEMTSDEKNKISHRSKALSKMACFLKSF